MAVFFLGILLSILLHTLIASFFVVCFIATFLTLLISISVEFWVDQKRGNYSFNLRKPTIQVVTHLLAGMLLFSFLSTIPLNIDRSFSVWILKSMKIAQSNNTNLNESTIELSASEFFSPQSGEILRRVKEQIGLGNIALDAMNNLKLTSQGQFQVKLNQLIGRFFHLNPKYSKY